MTFPSALAQLTQLYTKKVQRVLHYQNLSAKFKGPDKMRGLITQLIAEEREHLTMLSTVIVEMLSGEENDLAGKEAVTLAALGLELPPQLPLKPEETPDLAKAIVTPGKPEEPAEPLPAVKATQPANHEQITTPQSKHSKYDFATAQKPLVWNFVRTPKH